MLKLVLKASIFGGLEKVGGDAGTYSKGFYLLPFVANHEKVMP